MEYVDAVSELNYMTQVSLHADRPGKLRWSSGEEKPPTIVEVWSHPPLELLPLECWSRTRRRLF